MDSKELTKAEEQVMHVLWNLKQAFVKEIITELPEPKPAYNTVSTIVRILQDKGFVSHETFGKSHRYFPVISKKSYTEFATKQLVSGYFEGSFEKMVSFFIKEKKLSIGELDDVLTKIKSGK